MQEHIRKYISLNVLGGQNTKTPIVPLWNPSPNHGDGRHLTETRITPGCVGFFNADGGFHVMFNILKTKSQNENLGYNLPRDYRDFEMVCLTEIISL